MVLLIMGSDAPFRVGVITFHASSTTEICFWQKNGGLSEKGRATKMKRALCITTNPRNYNPRSQVFDQELSEEKRCEASHGKAARVHLNVVHTFEVGIWTCTQRQRVEAEVTGATIRLVLNGCKVIIVFFSLLAVFSQGLNRQPEQKHGALHLVKAKSTIQVV